VHIKPRGVRGDGWILVEVPLGTPQVYPKNVRSQKESRRGENQEETAYKREKTTLSEASNDTKGGFNKLEENAVAGGKVGFEKKWKAKNESKKKY